MEDESWRVMFGCSLGLESRRCRPTGTSANEVCDKKLITRIHAVLFAMYIPQNAIIAVLESFTVIPAKEVSASNQHSQGLLTWGPLHLTPNQTGTGT